MNKSDFFYDLPEELIAQTPLEPRDSSKMMVLSKENDNILAYLRVLKQGVVSSWHSPHP